MNPNETKANMSRPKRGVPEGLWIRCPQCKATIFRKEAESRFNVCPECEYHFYLPARERIRQLLDEDSFEEWFTDLRPCDPLGFKDRLPTPSAQAEQAKTGMPDAAVVGKGYIRGRPVVFGVTDFAFMAGSMGSVVGEKLTRAAEEATRLEAAVDLRQRLRRRGPDAGRHPVADADGQDLRGAGPLRPGRRPVHLHPDQSDHGRRGGQLRLARRHHPRRAGRLIGFAGKRTIWNTVRLELPEGFQTSEFLLKHGFIDRIVPRKDLRTEVARIIDYCEH